MLLTYHYLGEYAEEKLSEVTVVVKKGDLWFTDGCDLLTAVKSNGKTVEETACRLLDGIRAVIVRLSPVNIYAKCNIKDAVFGMLYLAEVSDSDGGLWLSEQDMKERLIGEALYFFSYVTHSLLPKNEREELWDVYDRDRISTGRTHRRGDLIPDGDYHLVVHVWVKNREGKILLTRRSANKGFPHMWECSGGSAVVGENSITAAIREVKEETGISVVPESGRVIKSMRRVNDHVDVWLFETDAKLSDVRLQEGETCDAKLVTKNEMSEMVKREELVPYSYFNDIWECI